jgi:hypothetical protein
MSETDNFIRARDNEADEKYLGTEWDRFHDFKVVEKTEDNVRVYARKDDPLRDSRKGRSYSGEVLFQDYNARGPYAPLRDEPDLFVKFASLASKDPGTRDGREEIMRKWIREYGVLGLIPIAENDSGLRSRRHENLLRFWDETRRAAGCLMLYEAATGPGRVLKRSGLPGKTLAEKRELAVRSLNNVVQNILKRDCYPKLYFGVLKDTGEMADVALSWGFHSLLGAMYLQLAWRIKSRRCEAPGCSNIIPLQKRSDKHTCSKRCKERRRQHRPKARTE